MRWLFIAVGWRLSYLGAARAEENGKPIYQEHCAKCHGSRGDGKGPVGRALDPKPTDFNSARADDAAWFKVTKFGAKAAGKSNGMEGYGKLLTDDQIRAVLTYCKTFKR